MKPDRCSFCKGRLVEGKTEFVVKVGEQIIAIKEYSVKTAGKHIILRKSQEKSI